MNVAEIAIDLLLTVLAGVLGAVTGLPFWRFLDGTTHDSEWSKRSQSDDSES